MNDTFVCPHCHQVVEYIVRKQEISPTHETFVVLCSNPECSTAIGLLDTPLLRDEFEKINEKFKNLERQYLQIMTEYQQIKLSQKEH